MIDNNISRNYGIDILRIIATLMVLTVHVGLKINCNFYVGARGVQLFFILSGFLAYQSLDKKNSCIEYYKRRAKKILPPYYICLLLSLVFDLGLGFIFKYKNIVPNTYLESISLKRIRYVFFLQTVIPSDNWDYWNNHNLLWSMSCFAVFYLLIPVLFKILKKFNISCFITIIMIIFTPYLVNNIQGVLIKNPNISNPEAFATSNPLTNLYCFLLGTTAYLCIKEKKQSIYILILLLLFIVYPVNGKNIFEIIFVLAVIEIGTNKININNILGEIIKKLSEISFLMYLIHPMALDVGAKIWRTTNINNKILFLIWLYSFSIIATIAIKKCLVDILLNDKNFRYR